MKRLVTTCFLIALFLLCSLIYINRQAEAMIEPQPQPGPSAFQEGESFPEAQQNPTTQGSTTQGSTTQAAQGSGSAASDEMPFEQKFWRYLSANNYKNWAPVSGQTGDFTQGQSPHGALLKMYLNRTAVGNPQMLPVGSILVKENYGPDRTLAAITVMYKSKGYNPADGDWYWVKYNPDGSVAETGADAGSTKLTGRVKACIECHRSADGDDFAFFND